MVAAVPVVVLTGGPSSGKTTVINVARQWLEDAGFTVITMTETATDLIMSGVTAKRLGPIEFQRILMQEQLQREEARIRAAQLSPGEKKVVILDRGLPDSAAYIEESDFIELLSELGLSIAQACDERYEGVIFLRSPAVDKQEVYTLANNDARSESVEEAALVDTRTCSAWIGAPHMSIIDNSTDMPGKSARAIEAIARVLGIPEPIEIENKYLIHRFDPSQLPSDTQTVNIRQDYLINDEPGTVERVRSRGRAGHQTYYHTVKRPLGGNMRSEQERQISRKEYEELLERRDPSCSAVVKTRSCFVWENQYFELDILLDKRGIVLLEVELTRQHDTVTLPPFVIDWGYEDVTNDPQYSNHALARQAA